MYGATDVDENRSARSDVQTERDRNVNRARKRFAESLSSIVHVIPTARTISETCINLERERKKSLRSVTLT